MKVKYLMFTFFFAILFLWSYHIEILMLSFVVVLRFSGSINHLLGPLLSRRSPALTCSVNLKTKAFETENERQKRYYLCYIERRSKFWQLVLMSKIDSNNPSKVQTLVKTTLISNWQQRSKTTICDLYIFNDIFFKVC